MIFVKTYTMYWSEGWATPWGSAI